MSTYIRGNVNEHLDMNALAAKTVLGTPFDDVVSERALISSIAATYALSGSTPTAAAGPFRFGICHSDYTDAQIEEWVEATNSWDVSDKLQSVEISRRLIRTIGSIGSAPSAVETSQFNDGNLIKTKLNWILNTNQTLRFWIYNDGAAATATETAKWVINGHVNLWQK